MADAEVVFANAVAAGAMVKRQPEDTFYGDHLGSLLAPFGHTWSMSTHIEAITTAANDRRMAATADKG